MTDLYILSTEEYGKLKDWLLKPLFFLSCTVLYTPFFSRQIPVFDLDAVI